MVEGWTCVCDACGAKSLLSQEFFLVGEHGTVHLGYLVGRALWFGLVVVGNPLGVG